MYAIAWERGGKVLWIAEEASPPRIDFSDPEKVTEDRLGRKDGARAEGFDLEVVRRELEKHFSLGREK